MKKHSIFLLAVSLVGSTASWPDTAATAQNGSQAAKTQPGHMNQPKMIIAETYRTFGNAHKVVQNLRELFAGVKQFRVDVVSPDSIRIWATAEDHLSISRPCPDRPKGPRVVYVTVPVKHANAAVLAAMLKQVFTSCSYYIDADTEKKIEVIISASEKSVDRLKLAVSAIDDACGAVQQAIGPTKFWRYVNQGFQEKAVSGQ